MTDIYIGNFQAQKDIIKQEISFLNYLVAVIYNQFFTKIVPIKDVDKLKQSYFDTLSNKGYVLIPKVNSSPEAYFSNSDRKILKNVEKVLKNLKYLEKYFYIFSIKEATLANLDSKLSKIFTSNPKHREKIENETIILNNTSRLSQYKDIVYGINDKNLMYLDKINFQKCFTKLLEKEYRLDSNLKKLIVYYTLGTTAVSVKGLVV